MTAKDPGSALFFEVAPHLDPCGMTTEELRAMVNRAVKEVREAAILEEREAIRKIAADEAAHQSNPWRIRERIIEAIDKRGQS